MAQRCALLLFLAIALLPDALAAEAPKTAVPAAGKKNDWIAGWKETSSMQTGRTGAAIHAGDGIIHMIGGLSLVAGSAKTPSFTNTTEYARVRPDGALSPWRFGPRLNVERGYFSAIAHKNHLYVVGGGRGHNGKELLASVERAEIKADGTLGEWVLEKTTLNIPRRCVKLAVIGDYIYAFGGFGGILLDTVEQAEINPDGSLGEWFVATDPMLIARYVHGVETVGDGVYNIGGHSKEEGSGIAAVEWSKIDEDALFRPWSASSPLQTGRYALATAMHNGFIYAIGGLTGATRLSSIERARISGEGELSDWEYTSPTPFGLAGAEAAVLDDRIYLLGGSDGSGYLRNVFYATFNERGDIGYWATPAEAQKHRAAIASREMNKAPLPHEAVILQHFKRKLYSYLQVREDNNNVLWLAAPAQDLRQGERISFPNGTLMKNFHSKGLNRRFAYILFVTEVRRAVNK